MSHKGILALETSCDETSIAYCEDFKVIHQVTSSQIKIHRPYRGVVPELASRQHLNNLPVLMKKIKSLISIKNCKKIAVTTGPGLAPALLVGLSYSKGLALNYNLPLIPVNHIRAHLYSPFIGRKEIPYPFLGLVVSGSHTSLYLVEEKKEKLLAKTRDDAIGEAFDKVARLFGLPYPGGPEIDKLFPKGDFKKFQLPSPKMSDKSLDFSFSGIKSHISRMVHNGFKIMDEKGLTQNSLDLLSSFQYKLVEILMDRLKYFQKKLKIKNISLSGGVAANKYLRKRAEEWAKEEGLNLFLPDRKFITDNAGMVGYLAFLKKLKPEIIEKIDIDPNWEF